MLTILKQHFFCNSLWALLIIYIFNFYDEYRGDAQLAIGDLRALLPADHLLLDDPRVAKMARVQEPDQGVVVVISFFFFARFSIRNSSLSQICGELNHFGKIRRLLKS